MEISLEEIRDQIIKSDHKSIDKLKSMIIVEEALLTIESNKKIEVLAENYFCNYEDVCQFQKNEDVCTRYGDCVHKQKL